MSEQPMEIEGEVVFVSENYWDAYKLENTSLYWNKAEYMVEWLKIPGDLFSVEIISYLTPAELCRYA